jgi:hypothetical protein
VDNNNNNKYNNNNNKIVLREIGWSGRGWINLARGWDQWTALVDMVMNFLLLLHVCGIIEQISN